MPQFGHIPEKIVRQHGTNGFDPKQLNGYLSEIDINDAEIERLTDDCKAECAPYKERADYESMVAALGTLADTPLGEAALKVARALNEAGATMTVELAGGEQGGTA